MKGSSMKVTIGEASGNLLDLGLVFSRAGLLKPHDGSVAKTGGLWSRLIGFPIHFPESGV